MWRVIYKDPPPEGKQVLVSWGTLEGSACGCWREQNLEIYWYVNGSYCDDEPPVWWMEVPELPPYTETQLVILQAEGKIWPS
jgi:hypothetical protein